MVTHTARSGNRKQNSRSELDKYRVTMVPLKDIIPSPENDELYGEIVHDEQMDALIESIKKRGLEEPLILTSGNHIIAGHRRFYAVEALGWKLVPCRYRSDIDWANTHDFHSILAEYNPQRIKSVGSLLKEALLREESPSATNRRGFAQPAGSTRVWPWPTTSRKTSAGYGRSPPNGRPDSSSTTGSPRPKPAASAC
jgi:hypothetical protein